MLRSPVAIDGGELHVENCTFAGDAGGSLEVSGGVVTTTDTLFVGDAIHLSAGGSLVYRLPAPLGHWINSLGQDHLTLQAAADAFGCVVMLVTSFEDDAAGVVSISPMLGGAVVREAPAMLSFYAERHYNALVPRTS